MLNDNEFTGKVPELCQVKYLCAKHHFEPNIPFIFLLFPRTVRENYFQSEVTQNVANNYSSSNPGYLTYSFLHFFSCFKLLSTTYHSSIGFQERKRIKNFNKRRENILAPASSNDEMEAMKQQFLLILLENQRLKQQYLKLSQNQESSDG